jgi:hypothetical protein
MNQLRFSFNGCDPDEVGVGWRSVLEALVIASMVVVLDEAGVLDLRAAKQVIVFQKDTVLQGLVPALNLALGLGMHGSAPDIAHAPGLDIVFASSHAM